MASSGGGGTKGTWYGEVYIQKGARGKDNGKGGQHNNNTRARKGAKIQLPKLRVNVWNGRPCRVCGVAAWEKYWNLVGPQLNTPSLASYITWITAASHCAVAHEATLALRLESWYSPPRLLSAHLEFHNVVLALGACHE
jgi:hypothetical protein